jgi:HAD superfamily hydrolase (TIGR01509 family)
MRHSQLLIVDLDGTLLNSEELATQYSIESLKRYTSQSIDADLYHQLTYGLTLRNSIDVVSKHFKIQLPETYMDELLMSWQKNVLQKATPAPHSFEALQALSAQYELCLASNGEPSNVDISVETLKLDMFFPKEKRFTKDQVAQPKPAPDLFHYVLKDLGYRPEQARSIEDSPTGVQAATASHIPCIGYVGLAPNRQQQKQELQKSGANPVCEDWLQIADFLLKN